MAENKSQNILSKLKNKATTQEVYAGKYIEKPAAMDVKSCPNCGAGRAQQDGLTHCAYCGFEFIGVTISDGINLKEEDNSTKI